MTCTRYCLENLHKCGKRVKLKVRKFWGLLLKFVEVTVEKLVRWAFLPTPSWIGLRKMVNFKTDLVYFTIRVPDTSDRSATRETRVGHESDTIATQTTRVWHEFKILILITTSVKIYFHTPILAIWQIKDYKERSNFIQRTSFWKYLVHMPKCVWKVHRKIWTLQWQKLYQNVLH